MVRMREAIRYLPPEKFELFLKIPFLLHINGPGYPGFVSGKAKAHGIFQFEKSGFYSLAIKEQIFPKSIQELVKVEDPCIISLFHIGSLGTFTQSLGSDFDYWVMIDKKRFSNERYSSLKRKLDDIVKYSRERYSQEVTFFIMDHQQVKKNHYGGNDTSEVVTVPQIFLKEEFYRTYLMLAGKVPLWSVMPQGVVNEMEQIKIATQILSMNDDVIDLGQVQSIWPADILKGLLWHICKSVEDPVKALIKATMVFSYGFGKTEHQTLLCENIKTGYKHAGIDDYAVDPYKAVFDRILAYHETCDPKGIHLIKNAIFFRLCGYPNVKMPKENTPKKFLLTQYINDWQLKPNQVAKLISYTDWSEAEKLLLDKAIIQRLAQMYNQAVEKSEDISRLFTTPNEQKKWNILSNKTRMRLQNKEAKIKECSTYLKKLNIKALGVNQVPSGWQVLAVTGTGNKPVVLYKNRHFVQVFGWILENQIYHRHSASLCCKSMYKLFDTRDRTIGLDNLYLAVSPVKPLSDSCFVDPPETVKLLILLFFKPGKSHQHLCSAEILIINTWGEVFAKALEFDSTSAQKDCLEKIAQKIKGMGTDHTRVSIFQFATTYETDIVYDLKKQIEKTTRINTLSRQKKGKPYLDRL